MVDLTAAVGPQPNFQQGPPATGGGMMTSARSIRQNLQTLMQNKVYIYPREVPKYYVRFIISEYARQGLQQVNTLTNLGSIILPLPMNLVDSLNVSYDERALGTVGLVGDKAAENIFRQMNELARARGSEPSRTQGIIDGIISGLQGAADAIPGGVAQQLLGSTGTLGQTAATLLGIAPNQFLTIVLEGPKYKMFEFQWRLSPNTPQEADDLRRVINAFKNHMSPGIRLDGALWSFPHVWRIGFLPNSKYLYKFKPAVLMSFTANYTPQGHPAFHRPDPLTVGDSNDPIGSPVAIEISARFLELEYWLYNHFNDTNNPWDASPNNVPPGT